MRVTRLALAVALALAGCAFVIDELSSAAPSVEVTGTLGLWHRENFDPPRAVSEDTLLDTGKRLVKVDIDDPRALGRKVRLRGNYERRHGDQVLVVTEAEPVPASSPAL